MINDSINYIVTIDKLYDNDDYATIDNQVEVPDLSAGGFEMTVFNSYEDDDSVDLGIFFKFKNLALNNSIINLSVPSSITFNLMTTGDLNWRLKEFMATLTGRKITVTSIQNDDELIEYVGYIGAIQNGINLRSGSQFTIPLFTLLSQLNRMTSNGSWNDAMRKYDNVFTGLSGSFIDRDILFTRIFEGTLLENTQVEYENHSFNPLPKKLWATITPDKSRLQVLKEILIAYNRIIYQHNDGTIVVSVLSVDDFCDEVYNVNELLNDATWLTVDSVNNAVELINRVDVVFAVEDTGVNYFDPQGNRAPPNIYATCPRVSKDNEIINGDNALPYTEIYKTSTRLYNSGYWCMPDLRNVSLGNNLLLDTILANLLVIPYTNSDIKYSVNDKYNQFPAFYSQLYMAEVNAVNYNATVVYDYVKTRLKGTESPLCKVVTIDNNTDLDYPQNLVTATSLNFDIGDGSKIAITTAPLLSIVAEWTQNK